MSRPPAMNVDFARPPAVIFDFDGLIIDTEWVEFVSICEVFERHGTELSEELWRSFIGSTDHPHWTEILEQQLDRPVDRDRLRTERVEATRHVLAALPVQPGVVELFGAAQDAGVPIGVASSSPRHWVEDHLRRIGLWTKLAAVATGDEVVRTKPDPAVYRLATERLGLDPTGIVAIEDSSNGCRAATAAGLIAVAVPSRLTTGADFSHARLVVDSVADLDLARLAALAQ